MTRTCAVVSAVVVLLVLVFLTTEALPALRRIGISRFVTDEGWYPLSDRYNMLPMIVGTLLTTTGAILVAGPLGICSAIFAQFYAPPSVARWYRRLIELLAGIPSVVFGLWGLVVLVPLLASVGGSGQSLMAASLILGLMILPMVALTAGSAFAAVPPELIRGGAALGFSRFAIVWHIALPAAGSGIAAGVLLAVSRAMGETMAVVMVAGNVVQIPDSLTAPVRTLTGNMALELGYAAADHRSILFISGLGLLVAVSCTMLLINRIAGAAS
ncbi:MAG: phosphate ABC transporter permease subunit PstC [Fuerstiella sp.]